MFNIEEEVYGLIEEFGKIITNQPNSRDEEKKKQEQRIRKEKADKEWEEYLEKKDNENKEKERNRQLKIKDLFNGIEKGEKLVVTEILINYPEYLLEKYEIATKQFIKAQKLTPMQFAIRLYTEDNLNMLPLFKSLLSTYELINIDLQSELDEWDNFCQIEKMDEHLLSLKIALIKQVNKRFIHNFSEQIKDQYTLYQAMAEVDKDSVEKILKQTPELSLKKLFKNFKIVDLNANEFISTQTPLQFAIKTNQPDMIQLIFTYLDMENISVKKEALNQWLEEEKTCCNIKEIKSLRGMLLYEVTQEESYSIETKLPKYYSTSLTHSLFYKVLPTAPSFEFNNGDNTNAQKDYNVTEMDEKTFIL